MATYRLSCFTDSRSWRRSAVLNRAFFAPKLTLKTPCGVSGKLSSTPKPYKVAHLLCWRGFPVRLYVEYFYSAELFYAGNFPIRIIPMQPTVIPIRNTCNRHLSDIEQQERDLILITHPEKCSKVNRNCTKLTLFCIHV